jgi:hypothetical protein
MKPVNSLCMRAAALLGAVGLLLSGCVAYDALPRGFEVYNLTGEQLTITARDEQRGTFYAEPGELIHLMVQPEGCESRSQVARSDSGTVVAQIPGGCRGYRWTIRGINDSTYEVS